METPDKPAKGKQVFSLQVEPSLQSVTMSLMRFSTIFCLRVTRHLIVTWVVSAGSSRSGSNRQLILMPRHWLSVGMRMR